MSAIPQPPADPSGPAVGGNGDSPDSDEMNELMAEIDEIERGLAANPADFEMLLRAARWGERMGRHDEACRFYLHAATAAPTRSEPLVSLSDMLRGQSLHAEAVEMLQHAIGRLPEHAGLWCAVARVMADLGAFDKADLFLAEALRLEPGNAMARLQRGALHRQAERRSGAQAD